MDLFVKTTNKTVHLVSVCFKELKKQIDGSNNEIFIYLCAMTKKKIVYIVNPRSGLGKKDDFESEVESCTDKTIIDYEIRYTRHKGHARELAFNYRDKVDVIVAVGGDGTINEVGSGLVSSSTALGIVPGGSGNGLARELDIPLRASHAIAVINDMCFKSIDVMQVGESYSFNVAGVGFDAVISHKFEKMRTRGPLQYMNLITKEYPKYKANEYVLNIDGHIFKRRAFLVSFANSSQWGNNIRIAPNAQIDDGFIDVCIVSEFPDYAIPALLLSLINQTIDKTKYDEIIRAKNIEIYCDNPLYGHIDGEPIEIHPNTKICILPLGLKVVVPSADFFKSWRFSPMAIKDMLEQTIPMPQMPQIQIPKNPFFNKKK